MTTEEKAHAEFVASLNQPPSSPVKETDAQQPTRRGRGKAKARAPPAWLIGSAAPTWLQLESVVPLQEAAKITSYSEDSLRRRWAHLVVQVGVRRQGMKLKNALAISNGTAPPPPRTRKPRGAEATTTID